MALYTYVAVPACRAGGADRTGRANMALRAVMAVFARRAGRADWSWRSNMTDGSRRSGNTLRTHVAVLSGEARLTHGSLRPDVTCGAERAYWTGRADGSGGTLVNRNSQNIIEAKRNVLESRGASRGPEDPLRCRAPGETRFCYLFSWAFVFHRRFMSAGFGHFGHLRPPLFNERPS